MVNFDRVTSIASRGAATVPTIGTPAALRSGDIVLAFDRTLEAGPLRLEIRDAGGAPSGGTLLAAGSLLLNLAGRRRERPGWDEASIAADGSAIGARIRCDGFDIGTTAAPAPDAQGFAMETSLAARTVLPARRREARGPCGARSAPVPRPRLRTARPPAPRPRVLPAHRRAVMLRPGEELRLAFTLLAAIPLLATEKEKRRSAAAAG